MPAPLKALRSRLIRLLQGTAKHDEIYDAEYYNELVDTYMSNSCDTIAESIIDTFSPKSVADVGCGSGLLLLALKKRGVSCIGLEYSRAALDICRQRGLDVIKFNLQCDTLPADVSTDVVVSTEVAEHLPEICADRFIDILCNIADRVVITASPPKLNFFRAGHLHLNEQPNEYWIEKFETRGFKYDRDISKRWCEYWKKRGVSGCYCKSTMVFQKKAD
jgi:ribosomal protein L11 methylase PrmA